MTLIDTDTFITALQMATRQKAMGQKHDAPTNTPTSGYAHGPGGLLTYPGVDPNVFNAMLGSIGMMDQLPAVPSTYTNPVYEVLTGVTAGSGSEPVDACDNAPVGGLMKAGKITAPFGRLERSTRELEINRMGQRNDRADPVDLRLLGGPSGSTPFTNMGITGNPLTNELDKALFERAVEFHRKLSAMLWTASPANTPGANAGYKEFAGFDVLINTGYKDAETGALLPSVDSLVRDFGSARVDTNGGRLVNELTYMYRYLRGKASRQRLDPVRWVLAMRETAFYEITAVWPCAYLVGGCTVVDAAGQQLVINASDQVEFRDRMRQGKFLIMDGQMVEVVFDDGIDEDDGNDSSAYPRGCFRSDIYFIPMSVQGGSTATTYLEYFDMTNPNIQSAAATGLLGVRALAGGAFLEVARQTNWCFVLQAKIEPRVILRTPWLAGRLQNVVYCPLIHNAEPFPSSAYWQDGGETGRSGPSLWAHWNS